MPLVVQTGRPHWVATTVSHASVSGACRLLIAKVASAHFEQLLLLEVTLHNQTCASIGDRSHDSASLSHVLAHWYCGDLALCMLLSC